MAGPGGVNLKKRFKNGFLEFGVRGLLAGVVHLGSIPTTSISP